MARLVRERASRLGDSAAGWIQVGFADLAAEQFDGAQEAFETALELSPGDRQAVLGLARVAHEQGRLDEAQERLQQLLAEEPSDLRARVALAIVLVAENRFSDASRLLADESLDRADDWSTASFYATRGGIAFLAGDSRAAISDLRRAVRLRPDWVHPRTTLALAELRAGRPEAAERHLKEAIRVGPLYSEALLQLLRLLLAQKRWDDVLTQVGRYWRPGLAPVRVALCAAEASLEAGDPRLAKAWLEPLVESVDKQLLRATVFNNLGVAHSRSGAWEAAERCFEEAIECSPSPLAVQNRGVALIELGRPEQAAAFLMRWVDREGYRTVEVCNVLAAALFRLGQAKAGARTGLRLIEEGIGDRVTYGMMSAALVDELGETDEGIRVAAEGSAKWQGDATLLNNWAYALIMAGRADDAAEVIGRIGPLESVDKRHQVYVLATKGLIELWRGHVTEGRDLYEEALRLASSDRLRARVKAKRDLEVARALLRLPHPDAHEARRLLERARGFGVDARPYNEHAARELALLELPPRRLSNSQQ